MYLIRGHEVNDASFHVIQNNSVFLDHDYFVELYDHREGRSRLNRTVDLLIILDCELCFSMLSYPRFLGSNYWNTELKLYFTLIK